MKIVKMSKDHAASYLNWKYEKPYEFYNTPLHARDEAYAEIFDDNGVDFFSVLDEKEDLFGIYEYSFSKGIMEIGFGIRPQSTGKGYGKCFVKECMNFGRRYYNYDGKITLRVADFNERAIYLYKSIGFIEVGFENTESFGTPATFIKMELL